MPSVLETERTGAKFGRSLRASTVQALRAMPADELLAAALKDKKKFRFWPNVDGYFLPESPSSIYSGGKQAHIALLAGWNADEQDYAEFLAKREPTKRNYEAKVRAKYGKHADEVLRLYPGNTQKQVQESARDLASDEFIAYSTWKWIDMQVETGESPVYRYHFEQAPPMPPGESSHGAYHSADIEYVFETLDWKHLAWTAGERKLSDMISSYWTNFAKNGNPNGPGLPEWPGYNKADNYEVMHLHVPPMPSAAPDRLRSRYELLDRVARERASGKTAER